MPASSRIFSSTPTSSHANVGCRERDGVREREGENARGRERETETKRERERQKEREGGCKCVCVCVFDSGLLPCKCWLQRERKR